MTYHKKIIAMANELESQLISWRRHFHQHPELSFQETKTSQYVCQVLEKLPGMKVEKKSGNTAVIGTISNGEGPTLALRADMDALPIQEENNVNYASKHKGIMHACGHDAHTAILLGAATVLSKIMQDGEFEGTVKFLFQPAEETTDDQGLSGAQHLIRNGVLDDVDGAVALHMCPWLHVGHHQVHDGPSMANVDVFQAEIHGSGGHSAYPNLGTDPIWMANQVLNVLYSIVSRRISPLEEAVVSVGRIEAGKSDNVIPAMIQIDGTIRSYSKKVREQLTDEVKKAFSIVDSLGGEAEVTINYGEPALMNDLQMNQYITDAISALYPNDEIVREPFGLGGEDFGYISERLPSAMFFLGCRQQGDIQRDLHTPIFDIDEGCLAKGVAIMSFLATQYLQPTR
ncbi:M20 metallopeptidase family protein [Bacillus alkalicellulosilyticus]|uniref:M20 metallopeptidase family protein n=1 Tax=Alkalihalobacterium alkalicellulosilyticum TaxID=1912214 RepID=UPI000996ED4B|nr:M20 family metallopeptidase [Bacillus alkalicellulosilyticus]